jgi:hypothetical protein
LFKKTLALLASASVAFAGLTLSASPAQALETSDNFFFQNNSRLGVLDFLSTDGQSQLPASSLTSGASFKLSIPLSNGEAPADFRYQWWEGTSDGCGSGGSGAIGGFNPQIVPDNQTLTVPTPSVPGRAVRVELSPKDGGAAVALSRSFLPGDYFCNTQNPAVSSVTGGVNSVEIKLSLPDGSSALQDAGFNPRFSFAFYDTAIGLTNPFDSDQPSNRNCDSNAVCQISDSSWFDLNKTYGFSYRLDWIGTSGTTFGFFTEASQTFQTTAPAAPSFSGGIEIEIVDEKLLLKTLGSWSTGSGENLILVCGQPQSAGTETINLGVQPALVQSGCLSVFPTSPPGPLGPVVEGVTDYPIQSLYVGQNPMQLVRYQDFIELPGRSGFTHFVWSSELFATQQFYRVWSASVSTTGVSGGNTDSTSGDVARMVPFTGPTLNTLAIPSGVRAGGSVTIPGSNLSGVTKVEIGGLDAQVKVNSAGELEIVVPAGLASGTYDIVLTSSEGRVTVQSAITVSAGAGLGAAGESRPSTKRMDDSSAKVYFYGAVGAGKIQFLLNGREIAWVNATDASDRKLVDGYLVRTVTLEAGKNVIEVLVDGVQVRRTVYSN